MFGQFRHLVGLAFKTEQPFEIWGTQRIVTEISTMQKTTYHHSANPVGPGNNRTAPYLKLIHPVPTLHSPVELLEDYIYPHNGLSLVSYVCISG
jgi:hypothetical protein